MMNLQPWEIEIRMFANDLVRVRINHANHSLHGFDEEMAFGADTDLGNINTIVFLAQDDSNRCLSNLFEKARREIVCIKLLLRV